MLPQAQELAGRGQQAGPAATGLGVVPGSIRELQAMSVMGSDGLVDPLAGMGLPGGAMGVDPLSMLAPALAGLGSAVPGGLGGVGAGLPLDGLGGLAPLLSDVAGHGGGDGFNDDKARHGDHHDDFNDDDKGAKKDDAHKAAPRFSSTSTTPCCTSPSSRVKNQRPNPAR